jgi:Bax protein
MFGRLFVGATAAALGLGMASGAVLSYAPIPPFTFIDSDRTAARPGGNPGGRVRVNSAEGLSNVFEQAGYRLDGVRRHGEVPRLFLVRLPLDLREIRAPSHRKNVFIKMTLPLILLVNERIMRDRMRIHILRTLIESRVEIPQDDVAWLARTSERYGLARLDFDALLRRVDVIPPSLALAQGAEETGWGTSRFAHEGNALFGQRMFGGKGGLVPRRRDKGKTFKVRAFEELVEGVRAYAHNLNTFGAYEEFRRARETRREAGQPLIGTELARALENYSERRESYIDTIRLIIRSNALHLFDKARLDAPSPGHLLSPDA